MTRFSFDAQAALRHAQQTLTHPNLPNPPNPETSDPARLGRLGRLGADSGAQEKVSIPPETYADRLPDSRLNQSRSVLSGGSDDRSGIKTFQDNEPWSGEDYAAFFDERAAIAEFDGGLSRPEAEALAFECCVVEWLNRNLVCSPSDHCLGCGEAEQTNDLLLPFGAHANGHAWLHEGCWSEWCQGRKAQAVAALLSMRITVSSRKPET